MQPAPRSASPDAGPQWAPDVLLWGLGTGRRVRALVRDGLRVEVLAIDVEPTAQQQALAVVNGCPHLRDAYVRGDLRIQLGLPSALAGRFRTLSEAPTRPKMQVDLTALGRAPAHAQQLAKLVERLHLERNDVRHFAPRLHQNLRANLDAMVAATSLEECRGAATGRPGFVMAAGPSARLALEWLPMAHNLGPLIVVDTALPLCREARAHVDCLVSVDPHPTSANHLRCGVDNVDRIAIQPYTSAEVVKAIPRHLLALPSGDQLCERAASELNLPTLPVAGTVLLYALQIAEIWGCNPIFMIGADFAHLGGYTHAKGTSSGTEVPATGVVTVNRQGQNIPTSFTLKRFCAAIESHIARSPARHIAIDGGGAIIHGARAVSAKAIARWIANAAKSSAPLPLPTPTTPEATLQRDRRATWEALMREFDCSP